MLAIFGTAAKPLISSGDAVADRAAFGRFVERYEESNRLTKPSDTQAVLEVGKDAWPFPIPLVKDNAGWRFDTAAGKEEILNRRIGDNELSAIQSCLAYVDAQREYYPRNPDGDALLHYARRSAFPPRKWRQWAKNLSGREYAQFGRFSEQRPGFPFTTSASLGRAQSKKWAARSGPDA